MNAQTAAVIEKLNTAKANVTECLFLALDIVMANTHGNKATDEQADRLMALCGGLEGLELTMELLQAMARDEQLRDDLTKLRLEGGAQ